MAAYCWTVLLQYSVYYIENREIMSRQESFKSISILNLHLCEKKGWLGTHNNCYQYLQYGYESMSIFKPNIFDICWNASINY